MKKKELFEVEYDEFEFEFNVHVAFEGEVAVAFDEDGLHFTRNGKALSTKEVLDGLSEYYGEKIISISVDEDEDDAVYIWLWCISDADA